MRPWNNCHVRIAIIFISSLLGLINFSPLRWALENIFEYIKRIIFMIWYCISLGQNQVKTLSLDEVKLKVTLEKWWQQMEVKNLLHLLCCSSTLIYSFFKAKCPQVRGKKWDNKALVQKNLSEGCFKLSKLFLEESFTACAVPNGWH